MTKLAIHGGAPVIPPNQFKKFNSIGEEEKKAALRVLDTGVLSGFYGSWSERFYGGPFVREIEELWCHYLKVPYTVSVNSATSGLNAALAAIGIEPGDEVIVTPYSMCASAVSPLVFNAIPVFADIENKTFGLDPTDIEKKITAKTRAILVVHLFGHPAKMDEILDIAKRHKLRVIEDCAQASGALYKGRPVGTLGDIGVFSLNCHKTIQSGEGGLCTTANEVFAMRMRMIRNHGENVWTQMSPEERESLVGGSMANLFGHNLRMTELTAAVGTEQIKKLDLLNARRIELCGLLTKLLSNIPVIESPAAEPGCRHVYYTYPMRFLAGGAQNSRRNFAEALQAEGVPITEGYVRPLYLLEIFQKRISFGSDPRFSFAAPWVENPRQYPKGLCPVVEALHEREMLLIPFYSFEFTERDIRDLADAFHKVADNKAALKGF